MTLGALTSRSWESQAHRYLESLDPFSYDEPLEERDIRLVQLLDAEAGRPIQCKLVRGSLDSDVNYQALSYVWGDPGKRRSIAFNDRRLGVTAGLHDALLQLRANNGIRENSLMWIDAICIDQSSVTEKNSQVRMMMEIYSHASYTIIWLGKRFGLLDGDVIKGVRLLHKIGLAIVGVESVQECAEIADRVINEGNENPDQNSLEIWKVFMRDWFGRIWVVQEFVASSSCLVYIGPIIVSSVIIFHVATNLRYSREWIISPLSTQLSRRNPAVLNSGLFWRLKAQYQSPQRMKLHEIVVETATFDATIPVDSIFALVGLACDVGPDFIDYSLDIRTVHINIARNALTSFEKGDLSAFDFLTYVRGDLDCEETSTFKLPSWAPNLRRFDRFDLEKSLTFWPLAKDFPSSVGSPLPGAFTVTFGSDDSLQVKAVFLDRVATVLDTIVHKALVGTSTDPEILEEYARGLQIWEAKAHSLAISLKQYPTNESISTVYPKTLSFDYLARRNPTSNIGELAASYATDYAFFQETLETIVRPQTSQRNRQGTQNPDDMALESRAKTVHVPSRGFLDTFDSCSVGRCFSTTENGYLGWVPEGAQAGDDICVFPWSLTPFAVRRQDMGYRLVGACYIEPIMKTENFRILYRKAREIKIY
ncbi:HET-domain-containing protein [Venustampulla echinocandica]|uniref:HET-domain-containing protein n=1 Tax=Venustampulla echinocandica TaxID=2656787 RepID=A0A370TGI3_9HELO|nr:HET-domain-containing protein [Venustampulla echinocandica]RDL34312.1 HET-domain-containing protein [Venustampulla echinocandica]